MGWNPVLDNAHQVVFNNNYKHVVQSFQLAYGIGLLLASRIIDRLGTKIGYAVAITIWALSSMSHAFVFSVAGFCIARFMLGLGESGNFLPPLRPRPNGSPPTSARLPPVSSTPVPMSVFSSRLHSSSVLSIMLSDIDNLRTMTHLLKPRIRVNSELEHLAVTGRVP